MAASNPQISQLLDQEYPAGFVTDIDAGSVPPGLNEDAVRLISAKKQELPFLLDWRLKAYCHWLTMPVPRWSSVHFPPIDYNAISYYSSPKSRKDAPASLDKLIQNYTRPTQSSASRWKSGSSSPVLSWMSLYTGAAFRHRSDIGINSV